MYLPASTKLTAASNRNESYVYSMHTVILTYIPLPKRIPNDVIAGALRSLVNIEIYNNYCYMQLTGLDRAA